jgi:phospholipid transport system substrate-binding protein
MYRILATLVLAVGFALPALAQEAPDVLVRNVSNEMSETVRSDKAIQSGDIKRMIEVVETRILKHFDFTRMTGLAVGREWRNASAEQKASLTAEFRTLLVRSYANALGQYKNQTIEVKPLKAKPEDTEVVVRSEIRQPGSKPITLDYDMAKSAEGWRVFDIAVAGVSLVTNYRETFSQEIKAGGIDGLIKTLRDKNQQSAAKLAESGKK